MNSKYDTHQHVSSNGQLAEAEWETVNLLVRFISKASLLILRAAHYVTDQTFPMV